MGVLEGHQPMIVMPRGGVIALHDGKQVTDQMFGPPAGTGDGGNISAVAP